MSDATIERAELIAATEDLIQQFLVPAGEAECLRETARTVDRIGWEWWDGGCGCLVGSTWPGWASNIGHNDQRPFSERTLRAGIEFADVWKRLTDAPTTRPGIARVVN